MKGTLIIQIICAVHVQKGPTGHDSRPAGTKGSFFIDSVGFGLDPKLRGGTETELPFSGEVGNAAQWLDFCAAKMKLPLMKKAERFVE